MLISFSTQDEKDLSVKGKREQWVYHVQSLNAISAWVDNQNAPHNEVKEVQKRIDSLLRFIVPQLNKQISDTTKQK